MQVRAQFLQSQLTTTFTKLNEYRADFSKKINFSEVSQDAQIGVRNFSIFQNSTRNLRPFRKFTSGEAAYGGSKSGCEFFFKVNSPLNLIYTQTIKLTFQKFYLGRSSIWRERGRVRQSRELSCCSVLQVVAARCREAQCVAEKCYLR